MGRFHWKGPRYRPRRSAFQHFCGWRGCRELVDAWAWGCRKHWFQLPQRIRERILATTKASHAERTAALREAAEWVQAFQGGGDADG